jgi:hypothetical protein
MQSVALPHIPPLPQCGHTGPPQSTSVSRSSRIPSPQWPMHVPPVQYGVAPVHAVVHEPQCVGVVMSVSQPSETIPLQSRQPAAHVLTWQAPPVQLPVACGGAHGIAQPPQFARSVSVSTQLPPHIVGLVAGQLAPQARVPPAPGKQSGVAPLHATPHAPHVAAEPRSASQPSTAMPLQSS